MDRLTKMINGRPHGAEGVSADKLTGKYCRGEFEATAIVERLSFYEALDEACMEREGMDLLGAVSRLGHYSTLVEAGRLVILPCKQGDIVWVSKNKEKTRKVLLDSVADILWYMEHGYGIGFTRKEAEEAMKGGK